MQYYGVDYFASNQDALIVLGDQGLREVLKDMIYIIPKDTLDDVLSNCVFLMLSEIGVKCACVFGDPQCRKHIFTCRAGFIPKKLIEGKNIFAFYEILYSKEGDEQVKMILHEIAHYVLGHSNEGLSDEDYYNHKQEKEANGLVDKWIDDWEKHLKTQEDKNP